MRLRRSGPPRTAPYCCRRKRGFGSPGPCGAKALRAFNASWRKKPKLVPLSWLLPARVVRWTTPPLKRPNSAGGLLLSTRNSAISSTMGRNGTCPGSGCSTEMPSKMYSLVRGRPPLMRGNADAGGRATPGASTVRSTKLRPFSGSASTRARETTCPSVADSVCSRGARRVTTTDSLRPPSSSSTSMRSRSPLCSSSPSRTMRRKPASSTTSRYAPGCRPTKP